MQTKTVIGLQPEIDLAKWNRLRDPKDATKLLREMQKNNIVYSRAQLFILLKTAKGPAEIVSFVRGYFDAKEIKIQNLLNNPVC